MAASTAPITKAPEIVLPNEVTNGGSLDR